SFSSSRRHLAPPSFPTRRSSDLTRRLGHHVGHLGRRLFRRRLVLLALAVDRPRLGSDLDLQLRLGLGLGLDLGRRRRRFGFALLDRKSTRLNSSHQIISYAVFCL